MLIFCVQLQRYFNAWELAQVRNQESWFLCRGGEHEVQVTDTPGLLYRPDEERNAMEMLTVATLEHLPTAALFVLDLTEGCGCSVQDQWEIRKELLQRFPYKLWIDVITKADLLEEEFDEARSMGTGALPALQAVPSSAEQAV